MLLAGCGNNKDEMESTTSIRQLVALYNGYPRLITNNLTIEGVVVSDDRHGEFHNKVVVEDSTGGVTFLVQSNSLFAIHKIGDVLRINCGGLTIGGYGGSVRVGNAGVHSEVEPLSLARWEEQCRFVGIADSLPYTTTHIGAVSAEHLSTRLLLESVRFVEAGEEWAPSNEPITRHLVDFLSGTDTLDVRLSGKSDFAHKEIPAGECSLFGVLDYFNHRYQLLLASPDEVLSHSEN